MASAHFNPHLRTTKTTKSIMRDVCIALLPAMCYSIYLFGWNVLVLVAASVITCIASEYLWQKLRGLPITVGDYSAAVTGMLLAFNMSPKTPAWVVIAASVFSIIVVKQAFGGLGSNIVNPALMGRLFVMLVYPSYLMTYVAPGVDAVSSTTVLELVQSGQAVGYTYWDMFIGNIPGALGETSALFLLIGFAYLAYSQEVNFIISGVYIGTVVLLTTIFGGDPLVNLLSGGLILGGCFMLTDYTFATIRGKIFMGLLAGVITASIRIWSFYPEGVCFGILAANCIMGLVGRLEKTHVYGTTS
jgi:electron transport complex protein RnfD